MTDDVTQIGARVDEQLHNRFKSVVKFEHDADRGPVAPAHEKAMKYYMTHFFVQNPDALEELANSDRVESDPDDFEQAIHRYMDNVGADIAESACVIEEAAAPGDDTRQLRDHFPNPLQIWYRAREKLFPSAPSIDIQKERLEEVHRLALQFGSIEEVKERLDVLEDLEQDPNESEPVQPSD